MLLVAVLCAPRVARAEDAQPRQSPTGVCPAFWNDVPTDLVGNIYLVEDRGGNTLLPPYRPIGEARPVDTNLDGEPDTLVAYIFGDANGDGIASPGEALPLTEHPEYGWIDCVEDADEHDSLDPDHLAGIGADDEDDGGGGPDGGNGPDGGGGSSGGGGGGIGGRDPGEISSNPASGTGGRGGMDPAAMPMVRAGDRNNCGENHERNCLPSTLSTAMTHDLANAYDHNDKLRYARSARDNPPGLEIPFGSEGRSGRGAEDTDVPNHSNIYKYKSFDRIPRAVDIGVDREILRTSMAVYQPLRRLHKDTLEDEVARDDYLDAAMTLRGVTVMAMGFLDKTLGAGLAAINEQKHASSADHLLKQIAWTTTRLSKGVTGN